MKPVHDTMHKHEYGRSSGKLPDQELIESVEEEEPGADGEGKPAFVWFLVSCL